jgi:photosystem II stability/assembly factor-like uncharacterized protein
MLALAALCMALTSTARADDGSDALAQIVNGLALRAIGPAVTGGRIADVAVHPHRRSTWYVGAGSGGVWKTTNAGITWTPVFDQQTSFSIGEITLDPINPEVVWVGTGENVSGRHVAWGDGVYRSRDGGRSWERMGLERSEHIGRILVHPTDSEVILVAAEGPLWSSGGDRGVYRSSNGGESWTRVLFVDDDTGATDLEFHPDDPNIVYAATYQRRRTVWSLLAGGPGSGIWKSEDAGETWRELSTGLPTTGENVEVGKIGLAVTPADPDRIYATIEADQEHRGFYASLDRGESWQRRNSYISGGTGPHYYQEIEVSPVDADHVYQMDVFLHVSRDGGHHFTEHGTGREKHSDNHAMWIDPDDARHLLVGTDAGLYETFDDGVSWRHFPNLPISQFYKVALNNRVPYYDVLAGAQDLGTLHGPARTLNIEGVRNQDWYVPYGADGYGVAFDPEDPDVFYQMSQNGNLVRHHRPSEEDVYIRPRPAPGDVPERWNWDSPLEVSSHAPGRIYFGSQRVWRSDDRGDSWTAISTDLTTGTNRFELPVAGRIHSTDSLWDLRAMSRYATLSAIAESPLPGARLWTGSDDGLVHTSADGGDHWRQVTPPGLPERAFVNDVEVSRHDADGAFVAADNHKTGDFGTYLFATRDGGRTWSDISGDLPDKVIAWAIQQDHEEPGLLFLGAENGLYVTLDGGIHWHRMGGGVPTISFRDVKLQRRDDDVVGATFGRGIYVLDDYGPLRDMAADLRGGGDGIPGDQDAVLFPTRNAWWYLPSSPGQAVGLPTQGSSAWRAPNPPHGPVFTVWLADVPQTPAERRREREREVAERDGNIVFPGWDTLFEETLAGGARHVLEIRDADGRSVRRLPVPNRKGLHRIAWDMRSPAPDRIDLSEPGFTPPWVSAPQGALLAPGGYQARLLRIGPDEMTPLGTAQAFELEAVDDLPAGTDPAVAAAFRLDVNELLRRFQGVDGALAEVDEQLRYLRAALAQTPAASPSLHLRIDAAAALAGRLRADLYGNPARRRLSEFDVPGVANHLNTAAGALSTRMPPTATQRRAFELGREALGEAERQITALRRGEIADLEAALSAAGAPWIPGQPVGSGG